MSFILRTLVLLFLSHHIFCGGSGPVLIKMGDKKGNKKGGNLILISGGKCGSPTLIKGAGKKGGGEMILVGPQNNCEEKKQIHVVKQIVPIPYYIPKPVIKYILRHHYVPVRQVVMKPVPVPYPVKSYQKNSGYESGAYGNGGSGGGGDYDSGYSGSTPYESDAGYQSGPVGKYYSGSANYDQYDQPPNAISASNNVGGLNSNQPSGHQATSGVVGYKRQSYDTTPYPVAPTDNPMMMEHPNVQSTGQQSSDYQPSNVRPTGGAGYKSAATNSYFYESPKTYESSYGRYTSSPSASSSSALIPSSTPSNYQLYAPVYSGPNGQLYTTSQVFNDTIGSAMLAQAASAPSVPYSSELNSQSSSLSLSDPSSPSSISSSSSSSSSSSISSAPGSRDFLRIRNNRENSYADRSSNPVMNKKKSKSISSSNTVYKVDLERAKKLLTDQFATIASGLKGNENGQ